MVCNITVFLLSRVYVECLEWRIKRGSFVFCFCTFCAVSLVSSYLWPLRTFYSLNSGEFTADILLVEDSKLNQKMIGIVYVWVRLRVRVGVRVRIRVRVRYGHEYGYGYFNPPSIVVLSPFIEEISAQCCNSRQRSRGRWEGREQPPAVSNDSYG